MTRPGRYRHHDFARQGRFFPIALLMLAAPAWATLPATTQIASAAMADMSLEELANIQVTSVSKKAERLADAPASIYVITAEDIRRSGFSTLPDVLRLAPNLQVAQTSASGYAITARGFNGSNTSAPNKLLVMIDGRSVYTPLFSGVFWDSQDVMLEDIERIEVISGPGGTLWGVNAVNGVINVITREASATQGTLLSATTGNLGGGYAFRYGGKLGDDASYRVYGKQSSHEKMSNEAGMDISDDWHKKQVGGRVDWGRSGDKLSFFANAYDGTIGQPDPGTLVTGNPLPPHTISISGVNFTGLWEHLLDGGSSISLQGYFDRTMRKIPPNLNEELDMVDMQFQHSLRQIGPHAMVWGANYRHSDDDLTNVSPYFAFLPAHVEQNWSSLFAQDEITLSDSLELTLGARSERNPYTGSEFLPNIRLAWKVAPNHLLWTAASRTVRAPSRLDRDAYINAAASPAGPFFPVLAGGPDMRAEVAKVYELGYRGQPTKTLSFSATIYHADYDHLQTAAPTTPPPGYIPLVFANGMEGEANGIEMWGSWQVQPWWRLSAGFTHLHERLWLKPGAIDLVSSTNAVGKNPENTAQLRASFSVTPKQEFDIALRYVSELSYPSQNDPVPLPAYTAIDARYGWKIERNLELSVAGVNLFGTDHAEYGAEQYRAVIPSGVYVQLIWQN